MSQKGYALLGELIDLEEKTIQRGRQAGKPYMSGKIRITKKNGTHLFDRDIVCFQDDAVKSLKSLGNGANVRLWGYGQTVEKDGGKYKAQMMKVVDVRLLPEKKAQEENDQDTSNVKDNVDDDMPF